MAGTAMSAESEAPFTALAPDVCPTKANPSRVTTGSITITPATAGPTRAATSGTVATMAPPATKQRANAITAMPPASDHAPAEPLTSAEVHPQAGGGCIPSPLVHH